MGASQLPDEGGEGVHGQGWDTTARLTLEVEVVDQPLLHLSRHLDLALPIPG